LESLEDRCLLSYTIREFALPAANAGPDWLAAGPDGNVWSTEINKSSLARITPAGQVTEVPIHSPLGAGQILFGPDGNIWVGGHTDIGEVTPQGVLLHDYTIQSALASPYSSNTMAIAFGMDGNIWYTNGYANDLVGRLNPADGTTTEFSLGFGGGPIINGPDGNLWVGGNSTETLSRVHLDGTIDTFALPPGPQSYDGPRGLTVGPDGNLWMTDAAQIPGGVDQILRVSTAGQLTGQFNVPTPDAFAYGMTVGSDGALWFTEGNTNQIGRITVDGVMAEYPVPTPDSGLEPPIRGPDGNIWFSEYYANQIGEVVLQTATTTAVAASANPSVYGQPVTFTATVTPNAAGAATPTGTVQFVIDGQNYGARVALSGGTAAVSDAALAVGSHSVVALYGGEAGSLPSDDTAAPLSQVVNQAATSTAGAASPATPYFGQAVTFTATVTANAPSTSTPAGSVDFFDTTTQTDLGSATLSGGVARLTTAVPLPPGGQTITLTYGGNASFLSSSTTITVAPLRSIYVLNPTVGGALTVSGSASITIPGLVTVDSNSATALSASGSAAMTASAIQVVGGASKSGSATFSPKPATGTAAVADPLAALAAPGSATAQGSISLSGNASLTINPGVYSQIKVAGNAKLTLNPGVYVLAGGGLTVTGNGSITGSGVLLYNAGSNFPSAGGTFGGVTLSGTGTFSLTAAGTGPYAGLVLFQARDNTRAIALGGNAVSGIVGTLYAPAALLTVGGNAQLTVSFVVNRLQLSGSGISTQVIAGVVGLDASVGELVAGDLALYVDNSGGALSADELARINDAVASYNALLAPYSVAITEVSSADQANVVLTSGSTSPCGGQADGVLGCYAPGSGTITLLQGWDYYAAADPSAIGAGQYDFEALAFHELGHALGLGGSPDPNSVMSETLPAGVIRRTPTAADLNVGDADGQPDAERAAPPRAERGSLLSEPIATLAAAAPAAVRGAGSQPGSLLPTGRGASGCGRQCPGDSWRSRGPYGPRGRGRPPGGAAGAPGRCRDPVHAAALGRSRLHRRGWERSRRHAGRRAGAPRCGQRRLLPGPAAGRRRTDAIPGRRRCECGGCPRGPGPGAGLRRREGWRRGSRIGRR
jgi:streptogramin lyase